jgi:8-amino-7-oxononanoate synthase
MPLSARITHTLAEIKQQLSERTRVPVRQVRDIIFTVNDHELINFAGNDYLGLAQHPQLQTAFLRATKQVGFGSGASQVVCGYSEIQEELETALAQFLGYERALIFSSGFLANCGVLTGLFNKQDVVFIDKQAHASLYDGVQLTGCEFRRYRHNDLIHLEQLLRAKKNNGVTAIVTDGLFSMEGDCAPLSECAALARQYQATLIVDDAHGIGVLGATGRGTLEHVGVSAMDVPLLVGTMSKAFGCFGGFVAGHSEAIELLVQTARSARYTTALPPPVLAAAHAALELIQHEPWRRDHLRQLVQHFRQGATQLGIPLLASQSPIQSVVIPDKYRLLTIATELQQRGFWVGVMRPPSVPVRRSRLRITLSTLHQFEHVDALLNALAELVPAAEMPEETMR